MPPRGDASDETHEREPDPRRDSSRGIRAAGRQRLDSDGLWTLDSDIRIMNNKIEY